MTFWRGLLQARSHLAFFVGLLVAFAIMRAVDQAIPPTPQAPLPQAPPASEKLPGTPAPLSPASSPAARAIDPGPLPEERATAKALTPAQQRLARDAWSYFERNTRESGLTDSVTGFPSTTLWDLGSSMMAAIAARELGLIDERTLTRRMARLLDSLARAQLIAGTLPNRGYDTRTVTPVDYDGKPLNAVSDGKPLNAVGDGRPLTAAHGGWSALDLGRFGVPLQILAWRAPALSGRIRALLGRWRLEAATQGGELRSGELKEGVVVRSQEGRLGYEQYAAASLSLLGLDVARARDFRRHLLPVAVSGQKVPSDDRAPAQHGGVQNPVLSEPWILLGLEFGLDEDSRPLARAVLLAQEARAKETGLLTAVSEDNLDRAPFFVYATLLDAGQPWRVYDTQGRDQPTLRTLSTKAALGWAALFQDAYVERLETAAEEAGMKGKGLYSGRYEQGDGFNQAMTANTCGIALEALAYRLRGPLLRTARRP